MNIPEHERQNYRRWQRMARRIGKFVPAGQTWTRASAACVCPICGLDYIDHPSTSEDQIIVVCDGSQYKL